MPFTMFDWVKQWLEIVKASQSRSVGKQIRNAPTPFVVPFTTFKKKEAFAKRLSPEEWTVR
jgi:hypothetical protein